MCGIVGFVGARNDDALAAMNAALHHRGPDGEGRYSDPALGVHLAQGRLIVVDPEGGRQPMASDDGGIQVIFNGEIYNHRELRRDLEARGHRFRSDHSDTEVLVHGYREWGEALPEHLSGMFAYALLDRGRRRLLLARDRFGKKPLYLTRQGDTFAFASELTALLHHPEIAARPDPAAVRKLFAYGFIPAPLSLYRGIEKLPAGSQLVLDLADGSRRQNRYWQFRIAPEGNARDHDPDQVVARIRELLAAAVERRLEADVPVGLLLSGGIDSSAVLHFAGRAGQTVRTFSVGFREPSFDESPHIERMVAVSGADHHHQTLSLEDARTLLPDILSRMDEPLGDPSVLPTYLVCRMAREKVTVALGGDGGDELFAGYDPFRALAAARLYARLVPRPMHQAIRLVAARLPLSDRNMSLEFRIKRSLRGLSYPASAWNPVWLGALEPSDIAELMQAPCRTEEVYEEAIDLWESCASDDPVDRTLEFYTNLYLTEDILVKADRASMMNSLELRSPFLDNDLVDYVRRLPASLKFRGGTTKYILKRAMRGLLPDEIIDRPKKGFGIPLNRWLRDWPATEIPAPVDGLSTEMQASLWRSHREGAGDHRQSLWNLLSLTQTLRQHQRLTPEA